MMTPRTPLDICIVTCDIVGPIRNGGIGTAYYSMARTLADAGHRVTVLYALGDYCENQSIAHWRAAYRDMGIAFVPMPDAGDVQGHSAIKMAAGVYRWLKDKTFDIVHIHEWRGIGFYALLAKRQGLAMQNSVVVVGAHSPVLWHLEGMNELASAEELEVDFMERESVALADVFWSPSQYMVEWMTREGWRFPRTVVVKPNLVLPDDRTPAAQTAGGAVRELVFFGRLETRKGLDLFCDALDRLAARGVRVPPVAFLGKTASVNGVPSDTYLHTRAAAWTFPWTIVSDKDRDAAMAYLREPGRVAVLPSRIDNLPYTVLECLSAGIPFIASHVGGIPEMIRDEDRDRVLFALTPEAFARCLERVLADGAAPVQPRVDAADTDADWLAWHASATRRISRRHARKTAAPDVSICVTHHNRAALLEQALDSIRRQDYPRIQVVLVDDGSDEASALALLDALEPEFHARGWLIVRQTNRYLGAARNAAIRHATGKYVMFMDDDNVAEPHEVSTFVRAAEASGADILTCFLRVFQSPTPPASRDGLPCWPFLGPARAPGLLRNVFGDANAFIRRDVFDQIGGFTEDVGVGCEDWEFFARATLRGLRLHVVPEPLVLYRQSGSGMLSTTSQHRNRMRALRPYFELVPPAFRGMIHLTHTHQLAAPADGPALPLDHVRRVVVFGTGEAGKRAIGLASRCGWDVSHLVDNNAGMWDTAAHDLPVRSPQTLLDRDFDLVIVASIGGRQAIFSQLEKMGLSHASDFVHFLEPVNVAGLTTRVTLP